MLLVACSESMCYEGITYVAVHEPGARVVSVETNDEVAGGGKHGDIAAGSVGGLQCDRRVPGAGALCKNPEVVTVEMDRVSETNGVLDDEVNPDVGLVKVNDILLGGVGVVAVDDLLDSRVAPIGKEGAVVQGPLELAADYLETDSEGLIVSLLAGLDSNNRDQVRHGLVPAVVHVGADLSSGVSSRGRVVADDALDVEGVLVGRAGELRDGAQPVVVSGLVGTNDDIVALADTDGDAGGVVRVNGDEIGRDDLQGVVVNHELPHGVDGTVDQAHAVGLSSLKVGGEAGAAAVIHARAVDQTGVGGRGTVGGCGGVELVTGLVEPIAEHDGAEIFVVGGGSRAVDNDTTEETVPGIC